MNMEYFKAIMSVMMLCGCAVSHVFVQHPDCPSGSSQLLSPCEDQCDTDKPCDEHTICCYGSCEKRGADLGLNDHVHYYKVCTYPDVCNRGVCKNGAKCLRKGEIEYICECSAGFVGDNCEIDINECADNPCVNDGVCQDLIADFRCCCPVDYTGKMCEQVLQCKSRPQFVRQADACSNAECAGYPEATCELKPHFFTYTYDYRGEISYEDVTEECEHIEP